MRIHHCVCFMLIADNQLLLEKRADTDRIGAVELNVPGGHMEIGERKEDTLLREVEEELGVIPLSYSFLCAQPFVAKEAQLLHYFVVTEWVGDIRAQEAAQVEWHSLDSELVLSAADQVAVQSLLSSNAPKRQIKADTSN